MKTLRIAVDMDDVQCRFVQRILEWFNKDKGTNLKVSDIKTWELTGELAAAVGLPPEEGNVYLRMYMRYPSFFQDLAPMPGAIKGMERLIK
jgi:5'(3')-deoxyribonucleotidase